ncbi:MAG: phage baseplate assembly protein V [Deltaproteobacteria bacterium HGW-Deltaproteobacteria-8]|jgi:phage baseplate assembly protein V|nr:MAG: phage baseplate assembly protein V [Deltaproteobacteria bacterium HGW-Deltaproteobacteria-8]
MKKLIAEAIKRHLAGIRLPFRAQLTGHDTAPGVGLVQAKALAGEKLQAAELFQHYGLTSAPPAGTMLLVVPVGGFTAHGIVVGEENSGFRLRGLKSGEVALYTDEGDHIILKRGRIMEIETETLRVKAATQVVFETPAFSMTNSGGATTATIQGSLHTTGGITSDGDHVAGDVSLEHHTHPGDSGGVTGPPIGS